MITKDGLLVAFLPHHHSRNRRMASNRRGNCRVRCDSDVVLVVDLMAAVVGGVVAAAMGLVMMASVSWPACADAAFLVHPTASGTITRWRAKLLYPPPSSSCPLTSEGAKRRVPAARGSGPPPPAAAAAAPESAAGIRQEPPSVPTSQLSSSNTSPVVSVDPDNANRRRFMYMTEQQDQKLQRLGDSEADLMSRRGPAERLRPTDITRAVKQLRRAQRYSETAATTTAGSSIRSGSGFGGGQKKSNNDNKAKHPSNITAMTGDNDRWWSEEAAAYAQVLESEGLVCIENVLPDSLADTLRTYLVDLRDRSRRDVESGVVQDSRDRFADVLLNQNRCDLKVPLGPEPVHRALRHLLSPDRTILRDLIEKVFDRYCGDDGGFTGGDATLYELNCFMSQSGARRQLVHADNVCFSVADADDGTDDPAAGSFSSAAASTVLEPSEPIMLTCFVALQDVDETMGPTYFLPGTNNLESHRQFFETSAADAVASLSLSGPPSTESLLSSKERLLSTRKVVMGTLRKGSCILFDPRTLHCAGANVCVDTDKTRALFYFSFKNPKVDSPGCPSCGGYGIPGAELTIRQLCAELDAQAAQSRDEGEESRRDNDADDSDDHRGSRGSSSSRRGVLLYPNLAMLASNP